MFKIYFEKVCDFIECDFLGFVLLRMRFPSKWRHWIHNVRVYRQLWFCLMGALLMNLGYKDGLCKTSIIHFCSYWKQKI